MFAHELTPGLLKLSQLPSTSPTDENENVDKIRLSFTVRAKGSDRPSSVLHSHGSPLPPSYTFSVFLNLFIKTGETNQALIFSDTLYHLDPFTRFNYL